MGKEETTNRVGPQTDDQQEVTFNYIKSNYFRVVHADGAWGGISPRGDIHIAFYNERAAIPDFSKLVVSDQGRIIAPEEFSATSELVREVEIDVVVDLVTAKGLQVWLTDKIQALETKVQEAKREVAKTE